MGSSKIAYCKCGCKCKATKEHSKTATPTERNSHDVVECGRSCPPFVSKQDCSEPKLSNSGQSVWCVETIKRPHATQERSVERLYIFKLKTPPTHAYWTLLLLAMTVTALVHQQPQVCAFTIPVAAPKERQQPQEAWPIAAEGKQRHKRDTDWDQLYVREMSANPVVWVNPCNGFCSAENLTEDQRLPVQLSLRTLRKRVRKMRTTLRNTATYISIGSMSQFSKFHAVYKFLPVVKSNSTVTLRRWHRDLQWYVGFFSYFYRAELHWDYNKLPNTIKSEATTELEVLKNHARSILCEIETTINNTAAHHRRHQRGIRYISKAVMERRLQNFETTLEHIHPKHYVAFNATGHHHQQSIEVKALDLMFLKYRYFRFLRSMLAALRENTSRRGVFTLDSRSSSSISGSSSAQESALASLSSISSSSSSSQQIDPILWNSSNNSHGTGNSNELALPRRTSTISGESTKTKRPRSQQRRKRKKLRQAVHYFY